MTSTLLPGSVGLGCFPMKLEGCKVELGILRMGAHGANPTTVDCPTPEALCLHVSFTQPPERKDSDFQRTQYLYSLEILQPGSHCP